MGLAALLAVSPKIKQRIELSRAKHRSLAGHSRMAKRLARLMPGYSFKEDRFSTATAPPRTWRNVDTRHFCAGADTAKSPCPVAGRDGQGA